MHESILLKGLLKRSNYAKYIPVLQEIDSFPREVRMVLTVLGEFFKTNPERRELNEDEVLVLFTSLFPSSTKEIEYVKQVLDSMRGLRIENEEVLTNALNVVVYRHFLSRIMARANKGLDKYDPDIPDQIVSDVNAYRVLVDSARDPRARAHKKTMPEIVRQEKSIDLSWRTPVLQRALGNPRPGRLHHVFGHVHSGKSLLLISECTNFGRQLFLKGRDDVVVYLTNEEGCDQLLPRIYASFLNQPISLIYQFPERAEKAYSENGGKNILVYDDVHHISAVHAYIEAIRPKVLFIDQGTKIAMRGKTEARHELLQKLYYEYRKLVVQYQIDIVTCGQASDDSRHKRWLSDRDMDGSKVGLPGELDVAIGIGRDDAEGKELIRYLHVPKNRYNGRIERDTVIIDQERVRFVSNEDV